MSRKNDIKACSNERASDGSRILQAWLPQVMLKIFRFMSRRSFSWERLLFVIITAAFIAAIAIFINLGRYNRYMADDYCHAAALNRSGFVHVQVSNYLSWGGRFTYAAL